MFKNNSRRGSLDYRFQADLTDEEALMVRKVMNHYKFTSDKKLLVALIKRALITVDKRIS